MNKSESYACGEPLRTDDDEPNLPGLLGELHQCIADVTDLIDAQVRDENTRFNKWDGQRDDGRLPDEVDGKEADPWPGASDVRIPLVDSLCIDQVTMMKSAEGKAKLTIKGTEGGDFASAGKAQIYIDYLRYTKLRKMTRRATQIAAQWRQTYGSCVMAITWRQEWARDYQTLTIEGLQQIVQQNPASPIAAWLSSVNEPDRDVQKDLVKQMIQMYPDLDITEAWKQFRAFKTTGSMTLPVRYMRVNEPRWDPLKLWRDFFWPKNTTEEQEAPWMAWRMCLTETAAREKVISEQWPEDFVEAACAKKGDTVLDSWRGSSGTTNNRTVYRDTSERMEGLIEFFVFYYMATDATGIPCKHRTITCPALGKDAPAGPDGPIGYDHGLYPVVAHVRERPEDTIADSRSTPQVIVTQQAEAKWMRDAAVNQTDLVLQPPTIRPEREIGLALTIRPRGEIGERRANATRQMQIMNTAPAAAPLEQAAVVDAQRYFARNRAEDPARASLYDQDLADDWTGELADCWAQTLQLAQQFEKDQDFTRLVGGKPQSFHMSRDDIQGSFDLQLVFNTDTMDPEKMKAKAQIMQSIILPMDRTGQINLAPIDRKSVV